MRLAPGDYRSLIYARCESIRTALYERSPNHDNLVFNQPAAARQDVDVTLVPDFDRIKRVMSEIHDLVTEFETSLGPA